MCVTRSRALVALGVLLAAILPFACRRSAAPAGAAAAKPKPDILLITLDTTRADRLGAYGWPEPITPHLDRFSRTALTFSEAFTTSPLTAPAHTSIMTGLLPKDHGVRDNGTYRLRDDVPTLAEKLKAEGYATGAFVSAMPLEATYGLARGFDVYSDVASQRWSQDRHSIPELHLAERRASVTTAAAARWIASVTSTARAFLWVHYYDAHAAYEPPPPFRWFGDYAGEIAFADSECARLIGIWEHSRRRPSLTIVTSDHGEGLFEHGERTHGNFVYDTTMQSLLIARLPGVFGDIRTGLRGLPDVYATAVEAAGIHEPLTAGRSLLAEADSSRDLILEAWAPYALGWCPPFAIRSSSRKYIRLPQEELYAVAEDPGETANVLSVWPEIASTARTSLLAELAATAPSDRLALSADDRERLASLGYVGGTSSDVPPLAPSLLELVDPKDALPDFELLNEAQYLLGVRRFHEALDRLAYLGQRHPNNARVIELMAAAYRGLGELPAARSTAARLIALQPSLTSGYQTKASVERLMGCPDEALATMEKAIRAGITMRDDLLLHATALMEMGVFSHARRELESLTTNEPAFVPAWLPLGYLYYLAGQHELAAAAYEQALRVEPAHLEARMNLASVLWDEGKLEEASRQFWLANASHPTDPEPLVQLLLLELQRKRIDGADIAMGKLMHLNKLPAGVRLENLQIEYQRARAAAVSNLTPSPAQHPR